MSQELSAQIGSCPAPGSPTTVTSWQVRCCADRSMSRSRSGLSSSCRPMAPSASGSRPSPIVNEAGAAAGARACPPSLSRIPARAAHSRTLARLRERLFGDGHAVHGSTALQREAVFTTSPVTIPSPRPGRALRSNDRLAPCLMPTRTCSESVASAAFELLDRLQDRQPGPHSPLGVVLVCHRRSKTAMTASPTNFSTVPSYSSSSGAPARGRAAAGPDVLGIGRLRGRSEPDQVAEEHGDDSALLARE